MKFITHIIKEFIPNYISKVIPKKIYKPLGRWNTEKCNKQLNNKIDLSNEDHCGPCGQYALNKTKKSL